MLLPYRLLTKYQRRQLRAIRRRAARVSCVMAALVGYGIASFGVPVARPTGKDLSKPFACANRACGCMNADDCWKHCCCFTREQKLAWAVEHGVHIPAWVLNEKPRSCCQQKQLAGGCCSKPQSEEKTKWVLGIAARKCRGQGVDWFSTAAVVPAPPRVVWQQSNLYCGDIPVASISFYSAHRPPPVPPPRISQLG